MGGVNEEREWQGKKSDCWRESKSVTILDFDYSVDLIAFMSHSHSRNFVWMVLSRIYSAPAYFNEKLILM